VSAAQLIVYILVALLAGLIAERLVGAALPGGVLGAILAAFLGIWVMTNVLRVHVPGDIDLAGVPLFTTVLGAALVLVVWILLLQATAPMRRRWHR